MGGNVYQDEGTSEDTISLKKQSYCIVLIRVPAPSCLTCCFSLCYTILKSFTSSVFELSPAVSLVAACLTRTLVRASGNLEIGHIFATSSGGREAVEIQIE